MEGERDEEEGRRGVSLLPTNHWSLACFPVFFCFSVFHWSNQAKESCVFTIIRINPSMRLFGRSSKMTKLAAAIHRVKAVGVKLGLKGMGHLQRCQYASNKMLVRCQTLPKPPPLPHHLFNIGIQGTVSNNECNVSETDNATIPPGVWNTMHGFEKKISNIVCILIPNLYNSSHPTTPSDHRLYNINYSTYL